MRKSIDMEEAVFLLKCGGAVIIETDTVAGMAVSTDRPDALDLIYKSKKRDKDKPIAWLVDSVEALNEYGEDVPDGVKCLAETYWPGALTLIVKASEAVKSQFASDDGTIGLRMPDDETCLDLIHDLGCAIAVTSANFSGEPASSHIQGVDPDFASNVPFLRVLDKRREPLSTEKRFASTVVDCSGASPCLKRAGAIPFSDIKKTLDASTGDCKCE